MNKKIVKLCVKGCVGILIGGTGYIIGRIIEYNRQNHYFNKLTNTSFSTIKTILERENELEEK